MLMNRSGNLGLIPEDTDGDLLPDYVDEDSDNDKVPDRNRRYMIIIMMVFQM